MQWCCETNIFFKALSCNTVPHFTTLAAFVSLRSQEIEALFEHALLVCLKQGLLGNELFAIDGIRCHLMLPKNGQVAFKGLKKKRKKLKRQIQHHLKKQKRIDKSESRDEARQQRAKQTIETLDEAFEKVDQFLPSIIRDKITLAN